MSDLHARFRAQLAAHLLETLPEAEEARMRAHARECAECARLLEHAKREISNAWRGADHVPVGVLLRRSRDPASFSPEDRASIESHLRSCESCALDLQELSGTSSGVVPLPSREQARILAPPRPTPWFDRLGGGLVGALATAATLALMWPVLRPDAPSTVVTPAAPPPVVAPPATPPPAPAAPAAQPRPTLRSVLLAEFTDEMRTPRSGAPLAPVELVVGARDTTLLLRFEPPGDGATRVVVRDPVGHALVSGTFPPSAFHGDKAFVLTRPGGFAGGLYVATLTASAGGEPATYRFQVRIRP